MAMMTPTRHAHGIPMTHSTARHQHFGQILTFHAGSASESPELREITTVYEGTSGLHTRRRSWALDGTAPRRVQPRWNGGSRARHFPEGREVCRGEGASNG